MNRNEHRLVHFCTKLTGNLHNLMLVVKVEIGSRFIQEDDGSILYHAAGKHHEPRFSGTELTVIAVCELR